MSREQSSLSPVIETQPDENHDFRLVKETLMVGTVPQRIASLILPPSSPIRLVPVQASTITGKPVAPLETIASDFQSQTGQMPVAAVNGGMFLLAEYLADGAKRFYIDSPHRSRFGDPLGMVMIEGKIATPPIFGRPALAVTESGQVILTKGFTMNDIEITTSDGLIIHPQKINPPEINPDVVTVHTPNGENKTDAPADSDRYYVTVIGHHVVATADQPSVVPTNGYIISLPDNRSYQDRLKEGTELNYQLVNQTGDPIRQVLECGPLLVENGQPLSINHQTLIDQGFSPRSAPKPRFNSIFHHFDKSTPRTVIGQTADGSLVTVVFEGRQTDSAGVTLEEAGRIMAEHYRCQTAIAFDGGACAQLLVTNSDHDKLEPTVRRGAAKGRALVNGLMRLANSRLARQVGLIPPETLPETDGADRPISTAILFVRQPTL